MLALALWVTFVPLVGLKQALADDALTIARQELARADTRASKVTALTNVIAAHETRQANLRGELRRLEAEAEAVRQRLGAEADRFAALVTLGRRLEQGRGAGAPLPILHPQGALAGSQAASLAAALTRSAAADRAALSDDLQRLQEAQTALTEAQTQLGAVREEMAKARQTIATDRSAEARANANAAIADSLTALTTLSATQDDRPAGQAVAPSNLPLPVRPRASPTPEGSGWRLSADPSAMVRAPATLSVLHAGPLRGQGLAMVLELGARHTLILTGLGQVVVAPGSTLTQGQVIGFMPPQSESSAAIAHTNVTNTGFPAGSPRRDTLYMEARVGNRPVEPATWFAVEKER